MWEVRVSKSAGKRVRRAPRHEQDRLFRALEEMRADPFTGDVVRLKKQRSAFRRRVGDWRIFFDVYSERRVVDVADIVRRTSTTY